MSSTYVVIVLCIVVALLILMVGKLKFHAILALLIATITLGILVGTPLEKIPSTLNSGFGSTCTSVALVIFLGSLLGLILSETGAIVKLTTSLVDFCGKKRVLWAIGTSACILGIPVFPDTVSLLTIPLCTNLAQQTGISMMAFAAVFAMSIRCRPKFGNIPRMMTSTAVMQIGISIRRSASLNRVKSPDSFLLKKAI